MRQCSAVVTACYECVFLFLNVSGQGELQGADSVCAVRNISDPAPAGSGCSSRPGPAQCSNSRTSPSGANIRSLTISEYDTPDRQHKELSDWRVSSGVPSAVNSMSAGAVDHFKGADITTDTSRRLPTFFEG